MMVDAIPSALSANYQPYWALRAHLLVALDRWAEALEAYQRAIGLCESIAMREFLVDKAENVSRRVAEGVVGLRTGSS